jgi:hypothetical protein
LKGWNFYLIYSNDGKLFEFRNDDDKEPILILEDKEIKN